MLLKDLFWRSALRRGAGEVDLGSSSRQVFEVTDLLVPAGTDWSHVGHELGSVTIQPGEYLHLSFYMDIGEQLPSAEDGMVIAIWLPNETDVWANFITGVGPDPGFNNTTERHHSEGFPFEGGFVIEQQDTTPLQVITFKVGIINPVPATADITIVRARAAFNVL